MDRHPSSQGRDGRVKRRRYRWMLVSVVVAVVVLVTTLFAFGLTHDPTVVRSALLDKPAPAFSLSRLGGGARVRLADLRGQVVVINFWASWCVDCRLEHPSLAAAWERYRDQGVVLLGIPFQDFSIDASKAFAREMHTTWPLLEDPDSRTGLAYGVYGPPETFVISPVGRIVYKQVGPISYTILTDQITALLQQEAR